ncbi:MAG: anti-sigma factor antagonist [Agathobacter sp.]
MENMEKNYKVEGATLSYQMPKEVDHHVAKEICQELDRLIETYSISELVLDFSQTEFMDSSGIGVVIGRSKTMRFRGGSIVATGVGKRVDTILRSAGLYQLLQVRQ